MTALTHRRPTTTMDIYSDDLILDPYGAYRELRDTGPAIWMEQYDVWVLPRFAEVRAGLRDHETYCSSQGVALTDIVNDMTQGGTICTDPPDHHRNRRIISKPISPPGLRPWEESFAQRAADLVDELLERGSFDAVRDFARRFPVSVVPDLLGIREEGRELLLPAAAAGFNAVGPMNERSMDGVPLLLEFSGMVYRMAAAGDFAEGSWGAQMLADAREQGLTEDQLASLIIDYLGPSLDTTISALSSALLMFGTHGEAWTAMCDDPAVIPGAFNEVLRMESPIRGFYRVATRDVDIDGVTVGTGDRVLMLYGSANRDERFWGNPECFDVRRPNVSQHLGFGTGVHACVGMGLARMEAHALLRALTDRVASIDVGAPVWALNNTIRGLESLPATLRAH
jgi:cytochrome P450